MDKIPQENKQTGQEDPKQQIIKMMVLELATEFGFMIAIPLIVFIYIGKWLDHKYHHQNLFVLIGIFLALISSSIMIGRKIMDIKKRLK